MTRPSRLHAAVADSFQDLPFTPDHNSEYLAEKKSQSAPNIQDGMFTKT